MAKQTFTTGQVLTAAQMTSLQQTAMGGGDTTAKTTSYTLVAADAGTVVAMNAAGATTITVNTGLFAAGDTVTIQNRGAGVCTITAGTATVATAGSLALSQNEGGILYFTATGTSVFYDFVQASSGMTNPMTTTGDTIYSSSGSTPARLGIGTTGQVLTVAGGLPTWATPAAGGGGKVLQVVQATTTTGVTVTSTTFTDTNLTATITPTSATSKILIMFSQQQHTSRSGNEAKSGIILLRGSTAIYQPGGDKEATQYTYANNATSIAIKGLTTGIYLDSPATTSSTTYKTQAAVPASGFSTDLNQQISTITLMEIGA